MANAMQHRARHVMVRKIHPLVYTEAWRFSIGPILGGGRMDFVPMRRERCKSCIDRPNIKCGMCDETNPALLAMDHDWHNGGYQCALHLAGIYLSKGIEEEADFMADLEKPNLELVSAEGADKGKE